MKPQMKLLFPAALNPKDARAQQTVLDNARNLFDTGYTIEAVPHGWDGLYFVRSKDGSVYTVDAHARCACKGFSWHGDCKHRIAVALRLGLLTLDDLVVVRADVRRAV